MSGARCSARPSDLIDYARATDDVVLQLRNELHNFDDDVEVYLFVTAGFFRMVGHSDPIWRAAFELDDLASWVGHVGWAFAAAGAGGDSTTSAIVHADAPAVDRWLNPIDWNPAKHLRAANAGDWLRAVDPSCRGFADTSGYRGSGFVIGPDGRRYPLVAPYVTRDGTQYDADDGVQPGQPSVLDLDGRDPGWTTIHESIGVERWRDAPDIGQRILMGVGSTAAGRPNGSSKTDVEQLVVMPGQAPSFVLAPVRSSEPAPPPFIASTTGGKASSAAGDAAGTLIEGVGGAAMADLGSHAAFDVQFQQNADGRVRALYKRVYVGFDDDGNPYAASVWVTGPDNNDHVPINYAP